MDNIKLRGDVKYSDGVTFSYSEITLSQSELKSQLKPDLTRIKKGDKVWVEYTLFSNGYFEVGKEEGNLCCVYKEDIIAHFSSEPEKEKVELPEKTVLKGEAMIEKAKILTLPEHIKRHNELHKNLDELVADWISNTKCFPSRNTVMELMEWSNRQRSRPTEKESIHD